jgi:hypothetical protein
MGIEITPDGKYLYVANYGETYAQALWEYSIGTDGLLGSPTKYNSNGKAVP